MKKLILATLLAGALAGCASRPHPAFTDPNHPEAIRFVGMGQENELGGVRVRTGRTNVTPIDAQTRWVAVEYTITNVRKEPLMAGLQQFTPSLLSEAGAAYGADTAATLQANNNDLGFETVNPGLSGTRRAVFKVPAKGVFSFRLFVPGGISYGQLYGKTLVFNGLTVN